MTHHKLIVGDCRSMHEIPDESVHLMVTSPPYFNAPFDYKGLFKTYEEYLELLSRVARARLGTLGNALFSASMLNLFQRHADWIKIANFSNLTNTWWASCIRTNNSRCHVTPIYWVLWLYSNYCRDISLDLAIDCEKYQINNLEVSYLDAMATIDSSGKNMVVTVVNRSDESNINTRIRLKGHPINFNNARVITLKGPSMESLNDFEFSNLIRPEASEIRLSEDFEYTFPRCSVTIIEVPLK